MATPTVEEISGMSVADAKPLIEKLSADDLEKLRELEVAKGADKQRKGVLDAIDASLKPEELTLEGRIERIEHALSLGDPSATAMVFAK